MFHIPQHQRRDLMTSLAIYSALFVGELLAALTRRPAPAPAPEETHDDAVVPQ